MTKQLRAETSDGTARAGEPQGAAPPGLRVLVVDDGPDLVESMAILLELMGHAPIPASDGAAAIELARTERPDVALVDIGLPDMSGYDVAQRLRADPDTAGVWLVALTGFASQEDQARSLAAGFDRHLAKPVGADELERALGEVGAGRARRTP